MSPWLIAGIVITILIGSFFVGGDVAAKRKLNQLFSGREAKTEDQFYERFFLNSEVPHSVVAKVREIFQEQIPFDLSMLEADDDLSEDFNVIWNLDSMADVEIVIALEKDFDIKITDDEATAMKTFRAVVDAVWQKLEEKQKWLTSACT
jgi:acyl carrier protein